MSLFQSVRNRTHHSAVCHNLQMYISTCFYSAAKRILQKSRALANAKKADGFTALHIAAVNDHYEVIKVLIDDVSESLHCKSVYSDGNLLWKPV